MPDDGYFVVERKPNDETWIAERLVDDDDPEGPVTKQLTDNVQQIIVTVMCATRDAVVRVKRWLQDSEYCHQVQDNTVPIHEGIPRWKGTLTGLRYLRIDQRDDGEYLVNAEL
jgi:hypothetical protein